MLTTDQFRDTIEAFLAKADLTPTQFGIEAVRDPNFVRDIRNGRAPNLNTASKVLEFIEARGPRPAPSESRAAS